MTTTLRQFSQAQSHLLFGDFEHIVKSQNCDLVSVGVRFVGIGGTCFGMMGK